MRRIDPQPRIGKGDIMWENNEYRMEIKDDSVLDFEKVMLTSGECNHLLPMIFIGESSEQVAYYDCHGFTPLSRYRIERTEDAFFIIEKVLVIMSCIMDYLLSPAKVMLTTETVFFNTETGDIKIAYVPTHESPDSLRKHLLILTAQLKADISDGYAGYLDRFARTVHQNNYHMRDLINSVGSLRRELYLKTSVSS